VVEVTTRPPNDVQTCLRRRCQLSVAIENREQEGFQAVAFECSDCLAFEFVILKSVLRAWTAVDFPKP